MPRAKCCAWRPWARRRNISRSHSPSAGCWREWPMRWQRAGMAAKVYKLRSIPPPSLSSARPRTSDQTTNWLDVRGRPSFRWPSTRACPTYNQRMARGWESKSVEAQMEESRAAKPAARKAALTPEELQHQRKKADLMLSRNPIAQQLAGSGNERYAELRQRTLAELDAQIADL